MTTLQPRPLRLGLSPSPNADRVRATAPALQALLARRVPGVQVEVGGGYKSLGDEMLSGDLPVAWAPPIVCARVEMAGGRMALRAVRGGATSYRAGLVCRKDELRTLADAPALVSAWVDEDSAAGYLLARSWLAARHVDATHGFKAVRFLGSYVAALEAVAAGDADITSVFVSSERTAPHTALDEMPLAVRDRLRIFAFTGETPTDGIVVAPGPEPEGAAALVAALRALNDDDEGRAMMQRLFGCDELVDVATRPAFTALRDLMEHTSTEHS